MTRNNRRFLLQGVAAGASTMVLGSSHAATLDKGELYVVAEIVSKPESADQLRTLLMPFAAKSREEPGCREYVLMEDEKQAGRFLTYERWTGHAALEQHMKTPEMAAIGPKLQAVLAKPFTQTFLSAPKGA